MALVAFVAGGSAAAADTYTFDKMHSEIRVSWDHLGLSRQSARFRDITGTIEFDPAQPEEGRADVSIRVAGISTGIPALDKQLTQTKDFFDVEAHPYITFKSTMVRKTGERTGEVMGDLTINGISRPATLLVNWNFSGEHPLGKFNPTYTGKFVSGFSAMATIQRADWDIKRFIPLASDELVITIEAELIRQ